MTLKRDHLTKAETRTDAAIEEGAPALAKARTLVDCLQLIVRRKTKDNLDLWLRDAEPSLPDRLVRSGHRQGSRRRARCRRGALAERPDERHVNRRKLVKRQMFGRAKLDLLEARLIGAP